MLARSPLGHLLFEGEDPHGHVSGDISWCMTLHPCITRGFSSSPSSMLQPDQYLHQIHFMNALSFWGGGESIKKCKSQHLYISSRTLLETFIIISVFSFESLLDKFIFKFSVLEKITLQVNLSEWKEFYDLVCFLFLLWLPGNTTAFVAQRQSWFSWIPLTCK